MSTYLNDLASTVVANDFFDSLGLSALTGVINSAGFDYIVGDNRCCAIINLLGTPLATSFLSIQMQESNDNGVSDPWTNLQDPGGLMPLMGLAQALVNPPVMQNFGRGKRWLRAQATITGPGAAFNFNLTVMEPRKQLGG